MMTKRLLALGAVLFLFGSTVFAVAATTSTAPPAAMHGEGACCKDGACDHCDTCDCCDRCPSKAAR